MTNFQRRALTATIFAAVMLVGLFLNMWSFTILFFVISMGCLWEFLKLTSDGNKLRKILVFAVAVTLWFTVAYSLMVLKGLGSWDLNRSIGWSNSPSLIWLFAFPITLFFFPFLLLLFELFQKNEKPFNLVGLSITGIFYTVLPFAFGIPFLTSKGQSSFDVFSVMSFTPNIVAGILFLTWANDTFAYIVGSKIGKTPLFPRISPKKTWEGTVGGGIMCILTGFGIHHFLGILSLTDWLVIGGIVAIFGTLGDLIESMLKRSVGVKDSGSFMPGHGGFLDRFDAFIFVIPFVFLYLMMR